MNAVITILVIEDNPVNLELVHDLLEAAGHLVYAAASAEEGLRLARTLQPRLVLMDLSLPGMDGLAATRALRLAPETSHIPIIALTAHAMKGDEETALKAGCAGYLSKPINTRTFLASITACLASSAAHFESSTVKNEQNQ